MKVSTLKAKVKRLWVEVPGETEDDPVEKIWIDYRPGALTLEVSDELKAAVESGFDTEVAFVMMRRVLAAWDLEDDDGNQLGVSDDEIKSVPLQFLGQILQAIEDDSRPNAQRGATSNGSSQLTEPQDASQTGTSSFGPRTGGDAPPGSS